MRNVVSLVLVFVLCSCAGQIYSPKANLAEGKRPTIDGAYEFVSEYTSITKPEKYTEQITSEEWAGLWLFQDGRYTFTLMKRDRDWYNFPQNVEGLGYLSSAGEYNMEGNHLSLKHTIYINPMGVGRATFMEYRLEGDNLILTESMHAHMEDLSEGQRVIVLKRIK